MCREASKHRCCRGNMTQEKGEIGGTQRVFLAFSSRKLIFSMLDASNSSLGANHHHDAAMDSWRSTSVPCNLTRTKNVGTPSQNHIWRVLRYISYLDEL